MDTITEKRIISGLIQYGTHLIDSKQETLQDVTSFDIIINSLVFDFDDKNDYSMDDAYEVYYKHETHIHDVIETLFNDRYTNA